MNTGQHITQTLFEDGAFRLVKLTDGRHRQVYNVTHC